MRQGTLVVTIVAALISGLLGSVMTQCAVDRREITRSRVDTLKRVAANRFDLKGDEFSRALNEVIIVFNDVPDVLQRLADFQKVLASHQSPEQANQSLTSLFVAMCRSAAVNCDTSLFLTAFNSKPESLPAASIPK